MQTKFEWNFIEIPTQIELPRSSISMYPFLDDPSFSKISLPQGWNQQNAKQ